MKENEDIEMKRISAQEKEDQNNNWIYFSDDYRYEVINKNKHEPNFVYRII